MPPTVPDYKKSIVETYVNGFTYLSTVDKNVYFEEESLRTILRNDSQLAIWRKHKILKIAAISCLGYHASTSVMHSCQFSHAKRVRQYGIHVAVHS